MPYYCLEKIEQALNDAGKAVRGARIVVLGVSYKPGVGDIRESPALKIIELLQRRGADVATTTLTCRSSARSVSVTKSSPTRWTAPTSP